MCFRYLVIRGNTSANNFFFMAYHKTQILQSKQIQATVFVCKIAV